MKLEGNGKLYLVALLFTSVLGFFLHDASAQELVSDTVHNLSASSPGSIRAPGESRVCIFCHAPHRTTGMIPLWNRQLPESGYQIYQSSTLDAKPGQPTGSSKLCLSCHDGTIALGSVISQSDRIRMIGGDFMPSGLTNLGTDLSDDHPISFLYGSGLSSSDRQLASPHGLPERVRLDRTGQLQCTTCHDAHSNLHGDFLVMDNRYGALCTTCHIMDGWPGSTHRTTGASMLGLMAGEWAYPTVAENACRGCHRSHTAGGRERLLIFENEEENCLNCHNGSVASQDIRSELHKFSVHDPRRYSGRHDPAEIFSGEQDHVECSDCHNPHAVLPQPETGNAFVALGGTLAKTRGVSISGAHVQEAKAEYEVCFRCHGDSPVFVRSVLRRQTDTLNLRLKFSTTNPSFHPVANPSPSRDTVSLQPWLSAGSMIRCTDCHNSDTGPRAGGSGPDGPHGSNYHFLLERNYNLQDNRLESAFEYALCYKCHNRASILSDQSFSGHMRHIQGEKTPCSACHDPHGVGLDGRSDHTHLINFDTIIVRPETSTGRIQFKDLGRFAGSCTLLCHGKEHIDEEYR